MKRYAGFLILFSLGLTAQAADPVLLKTGREIFNSYVSILGVSQSDPDVLLLYQQDISRLPKQGLPAELTNNVVLATTELGGLFCQKALTREQQQPPGQRQLFGAVDFNQGPAQFSDYVSGLWLENMAVNFWQRDITPEEQQSLSTTIAAAAVGDSSPAQTVKIAQVICTLYASSVSFLVK